MKNTQKQILEDAYNHYLEGSNRHAYSFDFNNPRSKQALLMDLDYLEDKGFIEITAHASGFINFKLTSYGIDYMDDTLPEPIAPITINQAPNSINVVGNNNNVIDNYNNLKIEINNLDISQEHKQLLSSFIDEVKTSHTSKENLKSKVNKFLCSILKETTTGAVANILSPLLVTLFSNLK